MKMRTGFVSNSSSASFCIPLSKLNLVELSTILAYPNKDWDIKMSEKEVKGFTLMDNGYMAAHFRTNNLSHLIEFIEHDDF